MVTSPRRRRRAFVGPLTGLAAQVSDRRLRLGLTQEDISELADVSLSSVRRLEAGADNLSFSAVMRMLEVLGMQLVVSTRSIVALPEDMSPLRREAQS